MLLAKQTCHVKYSMTSYQQLIISQWNIFSSVALWSQSYISAHFFCCKDSVTSLSFYTVSPFNMRLFLSPSDQNWAVLERDHICPFVLLWPSFECEFFRGFCRFMPSRFQLLSCMISLWKKYVIQTKDSLWYNEHSCPVIVSNWLGVCVAFACVSAFTRHDGDGNFGWRKDISSTLCQSHKWMPFGAFVGPSVRCTMFVHDVAMPVVIRSGFSNRLGWSHSFPITKAS